MSILDDFQQGTGMFGITAMTNERKLARAIGPALAGVTGAQVRANADIVGAETGANAMRDVASVKDSGDTLRQRLINNAQLAITGMREEGAGARNKYSADMGFAGQKYGSDSQLTGLKYGQDMTSSRQKKKLQFDEDILDEMKIDAWKRGGVSGGGNPASIIDKLDRGYGAGSTVQRSGGGGGGFADQLLEEDEGFTY